jgi:predicted transcriptional regulator
MDNFARALDWLRQIDAALATRDGLRREQMAATLGTSAKTVHRAIKAIESQGIGVESVRIDRGGSYWYVYRYVDRRSRLFRSR